MLIDEDCFFLGSLFESFFSIFSGGGVGGEACSCCCCVDVDVEDSACFGLSEMGSYS